jgi:hypothetical protein
MSLTMRWTPLLIRDFASRTANPAIASLSLHASCGPVAER